MRRRQAGSDRASVLDSSAAAAYSHSIHVGRRASSLSQYAVAANQLTLITGLAGSRGAAAAVGVDQSSRYRAPAYSDGALPRCHSGCAATNASNSATVTGALRMRNAFRSTGVEMVGTG